jgi:hypothetical protein
MSKSTHRGMLPWLSARSDCKDQRFIQLGNSLLLSYQWQHLKPGASNLYLCMCMKPADNVNFNFQGLPHKTNMELMTQVSEDTQGSFWRQSSSFWCPAGRVRSNRIFTLSVMAGRTRRRRNKSNRHGNILLILSQIEIWQRTLFLHWLAQIEIRR